MTPSLITKLQSAINDLEKRLTEISNRKIFQAHIVAFFEKRPYNPEHFRDVDRLVEAINPDEAKKKAEAWGVEFFKNKNEDPTRVTAFIYETIK
jgi:hypothetical protein